MPTDYEAVKAGAKEAVAEWLDTSAGREAVTTGMKHAVIDWFELSTTGQGQIPWGVERAVAAWLDSNKSTIVRAVAEAAATGTP
jgi:hypothetical protein